MSSSSSYALTLSFLFFFIQTLFSISQAQVPDSRTFKFVNDVEFGDYVVEYGGDYRALDIFTAPFQLCFYNTTPNAYTLALRMGLRRSESLFMWVWEANRDNPVRDHATLTFGKDGNLVLADADGRIVWQTDTANKGVVGFKLLPNGNMVLYDSKDNFVWQSFDYPTDTLLVDQSLRLGGTTKLVSRASARDNVNGPYSLVLEPRQLGLYYQSDNNFPSSKPVLIYSFSERSSIGKGTLEYVTLTCSSEYNEGYAFELMLENKVTGSSFGGGVMLARPKYNSTLSFLRLGIDGNLKLYTYYDHVHWGAWEVTYTLFSRDSSASECRLLERCGTFGLCEDNQCVACPLAQGLMGWSKNCEPVEVTSSVCKKNDFYYYKITGVDHFTSKYTKGSEHMNEADCEKRCSRQCKCLGYFYHKDISTCWTVYELKTLAKVENHDHLGYIKVPNVPRTTVGLMNI